MVLGMVPSRFWLARLRRVTLPLVVVMPVHDVMAVAVAQLRVVAVPLRVFLSARRVLQSSTRPPVVTVEPPTGGGSGAYVVVAFCDGEGGCLVVVGAVCAGCGVGDGGGAVGFVCAVGFIGCRDGDCLWGVPVGGGESECALAVCSAAVGVEGDIRVAASVFGKGYSDSSGRRGGKHDGVDSRARFGNYEITSGERHTIGAERHRRHPVLHKAFE